MSNTSSSQLIDGEKKEIDKKEKVDESKADEKKVIEFKKYPSIETIDNEKFIASIKELLDENALWVVTEKVHGSNLQFTMSEGKLLVGRRTDFLKPEEYKNFYNVGPVIEKYRNIVSKIYKYILFGDKYIDNTMDDTIYDMEIIKDKTVTVFGELFGGLYNGKSVGIKNPVQREIQYCPHVDFIAFDITVDGKRLDFHECKKLFELTGMPYVKPSFIGKLDAAIEFSRKTNDLLTSIPSYFGLPDIEGNIKEGNVLKPIVPVEHPKGSAIWLKDKNSKFMESTKVKKSKPESKDDNPVLRELIDAALSYVVPARYKNLLSKEIPIDQENFSKPPGKTIAKHITMFVDDAMEDFIKAYDIYNKQSDDNKKTIRRRVGDAAKKLINNYYMKN